MGTTSQKLTYLNDTKTQLKDMINYGLDTGEKITSETTFRNYVKSLFDAFIKTMTYPDVLYNNLPKVTGTGTSVTLNDTVYAPMRVELSPSAISQETTTQSANLFDEDYYNNDNLYQLNVYKYVLTRIKGNRTLYVKAQLKSGGTAQSGLYACLCSTQQPNISGSKFAWFVNNGNAQQNSIDMAGENDLYFSVYVSNFQEFSVNRIFDNYELWVSTDNVSYVPFVPDSPSPDYPQQIHTVSGENNVKIRNIQATHLDGYIYQSSGQGIFKTDTDDTMVFPVVQGHKYIIHNPNGNRARSAIFTNIPTNNTYGIENSYNTNTPMDTEYEASATGYMAVYIQTPHSQSIVDDFYVYEAGKSQTYPLSLGDLEYCKIGDYEDEFYKAAESDTGLTAGKWYLKKNTVKRIFDGSDDEGWQSYLEYTNVARGYTTVFKDMPVNAGGYCNYFIKSSNNFADEVSFLLRPIEVKTIVIKLPIDILSSRNINGIKDWLSTHTTTMYYQLETPTYTLLSDTLQTQLDNIHKAISYQEQTNVSQTNNDLPFVIKLSAIRDLSGIFEEI